MDAGELAVRLQAELPRLRRLAERLAPAGVEPEDLVQDVVERAWRARGSFRAQAQASTWLHRILVNRAADLARRGGARPRSVALEGEEVDLLAWAGELGDPALLAQRAEDRALLRAALSRLAPGDRTVLVLFDGEEMEAAQIGQILGIGAEAVHKRVQRARWRLARELAAGERAPAAAGPPPPSCRVALARAGDYLEDRLEAEERARVDAHLRGCERCPPLVQALVGLRAALRAPAPERRRSDEQ